MSPAAATATQPVSPQPTRRRSRKPLAALLAVVALFAAVWAVLVPALQGPDEITHYAYVQTIAELGDLPGDPKRYPYSSELDYGDAGTNVQPTIFFTGARPEWSLPKERALRLRLQRLDRTNTGGPINSANYPPLFYVYAAGFYELSSSGDFFTRIDVIRLGNVLLVVLNAFAAWLLAGVVFRRQAARLVVAATVGLWPMLTFLGTSISPDALMFPLWTLALWMGALIARDGLTTKRAFGLGLFCAAGLLTKAQTFALLPTVLLLLAWAGIRLWRRERFRQAVVPVVVCLVTLIVPVVAWRLLSVGGRGYAELADASTGGGDPLILREFLSYLWQFYLPRLDFMTPIRHHIAVISESPLFNTWIGTGWGVFGWVNVWFPKWVYEIFAVVTALGAVGSLAAGVRWLARRGERRAGDLAVALFLGGSALVLLAAVHWTDYQYYARSLGLFAQGRYLLPVAAVFACLAAAAIGVLPRRARSLTSGAWIAGMVVLQLASLGLILGRWYA